MGYGGPGHSVNTDVYLWVSHRGFVYNFLSPSILTVVLRKNTAFTNLRCELNPGVNVMKVIDELINLTHYESISRKYLRCI